jgi:hypothetical protein
MSTFRRRYAITLDGEKFEVTTMAADHLKSEEAVSREGRELTQAPVLLQMRLMFYAFQRTYPDHPLQRNWQGFLQVFDDLDDLDEAGDPMDPTQQME